MLTTYIAPFSRVASILAPALLGSAGMWLTVRQAYPTSVSLTPEWTASALDSFSHKERQGSPEPAVVNPFSRWRY